jgi:putative flippase GtrA
MSGAFLRFCVVGVVGFVVDVGCTLVLTQVAALLPLPARIAAFIVAATVTWGLNRRYTFRSRAGLGSWMPYVLLTSIGALTNISVYWTWLDWAGTGALSIVVGVAGGSVAALAFNFLASRAIFSKAL